MPSILSKFKTSLVLCALALGVSSAWSAAEVKKPKNKTAAKAAPAVKAVDPEPEDNSPLNEEQIALAPQVHAGDANCEFKNRVTITPDANNPGRFRLQFGKLIYNMAPEPTTTGAVRLEDKKAGVVWLQIPTKSMLMNHKIGQRLVDFCMHTEQVSEAQSAALSAAQSDGSQPVIGVLGQTSQPASKN